MSYAAICYQLFNVACLMIVQTYHIVISHVACHFCDRRYMAYTVQTVRVKSTVAAPNPPHGNQVRSG